MASSLKNLSEFDSKTIPEASGMTFGIVVSEWNSHITKPLLEGCYASLLEHGAKESNIHVIHVPGSFELPIGARLLSNKEKLDAVICLGCVIKGETRHDEYINQSVAIALQNLSLASGKPAIFGLLTVDTEEQALDRAGGKHGNKGIEAAITAIKMAALKQQFSSNRGTIGFNS